MTSPRTVGSSASRRPRRTVVRSATAYAACAAGGGPAAGRAGWRGPMPRRTSRRVRAPPHGPSRTAERVVRRAGSASRRVAARSGLSWDPGLPRPDARPTVTRAAARMFRSTDARRCCTALQGAVQMRSPAPPQRAPALEVLGGRQHRGGPLGLRRWPPRGPETSVVWARSARPAATTRQNAAARCRATAKSPAKTPAQDRVGQLAAARPGPGGSATPATAWLTSVNRMPAA